MPSADPYLKTFLLWILALFPPAMGVAWLLTRIDGVDGDAGVLVAMTEGHLLALAVVWFAGRRGLKRVSR